MSTTTIALLLQMAASLLAGAKNNPSLTPSTTAQVAAIGERTIQLAAQAEANIGFAVPQNTGIWPTIGDLMYAAYLNPEGVYVPEGPSAMLEQSTVSFGDLNGDGLDDAAGVVDLGNADGQMKPYLAVFLNQGGVMFNIADLPLGASTTVYSHNIMNGVLTIDMQSAGAPRTTSTYELVGDRIVPIR